MSRRPSKPLRLKPAARVDLEKIWDFTALRWSSDQADEYVRGLYAAFERIADNPESVRERLEFRPPVRIYSFKSHIVVFREELDHIAIIRIRHGVRGLDERSWERLATIPVSAFHFRLGGSVFIRFGKPMLHGADAVGQPRSVVSPEAWAAMSHMAPPGLVR